VAFYTAAAAGATFMYNGTAADPATAERYCQAAAGHLASYSSVSSPLPHPTSRPLCCWVVRPQAACRWALTPTL
jgi:hypothetical protein